MLVPVRCTKPGKCRYKINTTCIICPRGYIFYICRGTNHMNAISQPLHYGSCNKNAALKCIFVPFHRPRGQVRQVCPPVCRLAIRCAPLFVARCIKSASCVTLDNEARRTFVAPLMLCQISRMRQSPSKAVQRGLSRPGVRLDFVAVQHNILEEPLCGVNWWQ